MRSIADELEDIVMSSPLLEEGLAQGVMNLSALGRRLRPQVEKALMREVSEAALVMALRRMSPSIAERSTHGMNMARFVRDLSVRSGLCAFTFSRTQSLIALQAQLLSEAADSPDAFITFAQGVTEITTIMDNNFAALAERLFSGESCLKRIDDLAAITVRLAAETVEAHGIYYSILKQLALNGINTVEVVSTYTELTIVLHQAVVDRAFSVLFKAASRDHINW